jgi:hypothetical protein
VERLTEGALGQLAVDAREELGVLEKGAEEAAFRRKPGGGL